MLLSSVPMRELEAWERRKTRSTQAFHILVPHFFFRCKEKYFIVFSAEKLLFFDISIFILAFLQIDI